MPKISAGILMFRRAASGGGLEVLLTHPGGPFYRNKDDGAWTIPKGEIDEGEDLLAAARREFEEEMGAPLVGEPVALTTIKQRGGKIVHAWAVCGDFDVAALSSNMFSLEWPPRSGRMQEFPEVDRAAWFSMDEARVKILASQRPLLEELAEKVAGGEC